MQIAEARQDAARLGKMQIAARLGKMQIAARLGKMRIWSHEAARCGG